MSILVTGGAGFLGSHLVDRLVANGERVLIVDDLSKGSLANMARALSSGRATFAYADIGSSREELRSVVSRARVGRVTTIFHLASPESSTGSPACIALALEQEATLVFSSSAYGDSRYCFGEGAFVAAIGNTDLRGRLVRLFDGYGPRMEIGNDQLIPSLLDAAAAGRAFPIHGSGKQTRSLTFVSDLVDGLLRVADWDSDDPLSVDLGSSEPVAEVLIAECLAEIAGVPFVADYRPMQPHNIRRLPESSHVAASGWYANTALRDGLRATYSWFLSHRMSYV